MRNENNKKFFAESMMNLISNKVMVNLHSTKKIQLSEQFTGLGGYFNECPKELALATGLPFYRWFPIYIHEYCHFQQFQEQTKTWTIVGKNKSLHKFDDMVNGKVFKQSIVDKFCTEIQNLELDCEIRTIETINKYNLEVDVEKYTQGANAYISLYTLIKTTNRWPDFKSPYSIKAIVDIMPKTLTQSFEVLDPEYIKLSMERCYKNA